MLAAITLHAVPDDDKGWTSERVAAAVAHEAGHMAWRLAAAKGGGGSKKPAGGGKNPPEPPAADAADFSGLAELFQPPEENPEEEYIEF